MTIGIPQSIKPDDEISSEWQQDEFGTHVKVELGEVAVTIDVAYGAEETVPWLLAAMPQILEATWSAVEAREDEDDEESSQEEEQ